MLQRQSAAQQGDRRLICITPYKFAQAFFTGTAAIG
jgi:hypothetical protein